MPTALVLFSSASFLSHLGLPWETIEYYQNEAIIICTLERLRFVHQQEPTVADEPNSLVPGRPRTSVPTLTPYTSLSPHPLLPLSLLMIYGDILSFLHFQGGSELQKGSGWQ
jgi:hypothetical protein